MSIYDNDTVFDSFLKEREDTHTPFNMQVKPVVLDYIGSVEGKRVLDIGCGLGHFAKELSELGATYVLGVDVSEREIEYAKKNNSLDHIEYKVLDANALHTIDDTFDIITSNIVIDYIEDIDSLLNSIYDLLSDTGIFVFSQVHPLSTAPLTKRSWLKDNASEYIYQLSDYTIDGKRSMQYFGGDVTMYHRSMSTIIRSIVKNNFYIVDICEPTPSKEELELYPDRAKNIHKPSFLVLKVQKK